MTRDDARVLVEMHAELITKAARLARAHDNRFMPEEGELLADQAREARAQADAIAAALAALPVEVTIPDRRQMSLLSLGEDA